MGRDVPRDKFGLVDVCQRPHHGTNADWLRESHRSVNQVGHGWHVWLVGHLNSTSVGAREIIVRR